MRKCIVQDCGKSQTNKENMPGVTFHSFYFDIIECWYYCTRLIASSVTCIVFLYKVYKDVEVKLSVDTRILPTLEDVLPKTEHTVYSVHVCAYYFLRRCHHTSITPSEYGRMQLNENMQIASTNPVTSHRYSRYVTLRIIRRHGVDRAERPASVTQLP
ncbi:hypothetical protein NQ318_013660 [Aromia moschata]|uniref:Uncharacterized protein n=1 Tax=Aromia moschata TaxID=1265417 RepID=A0AAV8XZV0_9CUCU|nr:hypothetical protein NQ318_013660 [Aromia moschata]